MYNFLIVIPTAGLAEQWAITTSVFESEYNF